MFLQINISRCPLLLFFFIIFYGFLIVFFFPTPQASSPRLGVSSMDAASPWMPRFRRRCAAADRAGSLPRPSRMSSPPASVGGYTIQPPPHHPDLWWCVWAETRPLSRAVAPAHPTTTDAWTRRTTRTVTSPQIPVREAIRNGRKLVTKRLVTKVFKTVIDWCNSF